MTGSDRNQSESEADTNPAHRELPHGARVIRAAEFRPPEEPGRRFGLPHPRLVLGLAVFFAVGGILWFVLTMRAVEIRIEPAPETVELSGLTFRLGENWLARPGKYRVEASKAGYHRLDKVIEVPSQGAARFEFELEPLPGRITFQSAPSGAEVRVDGEPIGTTPIEEHQLEPGTYPLEFVAEGYFPEQRELEVEGRDIHQRVEVELVPSTAEIEIASEPPGAEILVDGEPADARTPATLTVDAGTRELALDRPGYRVWRDRIELEGGERRSLPVVELEAAPAVVDVVSEPSGATVLLNGRARGSTPVELRLGPGEPVRLELRLEGYEPLVREFTPRADTETTLRGKLVPINARLEVSSKPPGAEVRVDGEPIGTAGAGGLAVELPAREYEVELRLDGHVPATRTVELDPDTPTRLEVELQTELEARMARLQPLIRAADGQTLKLVAPGRFTLGTPRGEQGRRANEIQREVRLERLFYMGTHEVTNEQFRRFRPEHSSGIVGEHTLDNDEQPVVRVSFDDAAAFCNWLSDQDGLEPAYRRTADGYRLIRPVGQGYRLASEAEWAWVARFAGDRELEYPWGDSMPPVPGSGNFADRSARNLLSVVLTDYDDGSPASALVGSYAPNALGFHDLGGNVSEWTGDRYRIRLNETPQLETDPLGPTEGQGRVVRGSSWRHATITELRLAWRDNADQPRDDLGFRIVRYAE